MKQANEIFPEALKQLLEIGEKGMKQQEQRDRAKRAARPRETRACMHAGKEKQAKQLKLELQTRI